MISTPLVWCPLAWLLFGLSGAYAEVDKQTLLIQQGEYWQAQHNPTRAGDAWAKLLQVDDRQVDALYGMGLVELAEDRPDQAMMYLARLRAAEGDGLKSARLDQAIRLYPPEQDALLIEARAHATTGALQLARDAYRKLFGGYQPQGRLAREYYQVIGYTDEGHAEAVAGLQRLVGEYPDEAEYGLALAMLEVIRVPSRRRGIERLSALAQGDDQVVSAQAMEQWRNTLTWLGNPPPPGTLKLFRDFLAVNPDDADMRARLQAGVKAAANPPSRLDPLEERTAVGMRAMEAGRDEEAAEIFGEVLKARPGAANALGGMGILSMRKGDFTQAETYLQQAVAKSSAWRNALDTVSYLRNVDQATTARLSGNRGKAERLLRQAISMDRSQSLAFNALADLQADEGALDQAAATYREVLDAHPDDANAWRGLVSVLAENGRLDEARELLANPPAAVGRDPAVLRPLQAAYAAGLARAAQRRSDDTAAAVAWREAVAKAPDNPWYRLALAQSELKLGDADQAQQTIDVLLEADPQNAEALYAKAMLNAQMQNWSGALAALSRIPAEERSAYMYALQHRAVVNVQIGRALRLATLGRQAEAVEVLGSLEPMVEETPDLTGTLAFAYVDAGESQRGLALLERALSAQDQPSVDLRLQYAGMLLKTGDDAAFREQMNSLSDRALAGTQLASYQELNRLSRIREAEDLRERGALDAAEKILVPTVAQRPDDALALSALARLYMARGRYDDAIEVYQPLLERDPDNLDLLMGAAQVAALSRDGSQMREYTDRAIDVAPDNTAVLLEAARLHRAVGKEARAVRLYNQALALSESDASTGNIDRVVAQLEVAELEAKRSAQLLGGLDLHGRDGTSGTSQMTAVQLPVEGQVALGDGRLVVKATGVSLDAGAFGNSPLAATQFGAGPVAAFNEDGDVVLSTEGNTADGVGYALGYERGGLRTDIGRGPAGFLYDATVGGLAYSNSFGADRESWYSVALERRQVYDSVLSWAGAEDSRTGDQWGGVTRTGGQLTVGGQFDDYSIYGFGGYDRYSGHNVRDNERFQLGAGVTIPFLQASDHLLQWGVATSAQHFDNDQNHFTYGHGGYFSPQQYVWLGVPVTWAQRFDRLSYRVQASAGLQMIRQDGPEYFPTDPARQQAATEWLASEDAEELEVDGTPYYGDSRSTEVAYKLAAAVEYKLSDRLSLGGAMNVDNASDYSEWSAGIYLRYRKVPQSDLLSMPIVPFRSPYSQ